MTYAELQKLKAEQYSERSELSKQIQGLMAAVQDGTPTDEQDKQLQSLKASIEKVTGKIDATESEIAAIDAKRDEYKQSLAKISPLLVGKEADAHNADPAKLSEWAIPKTVAWQIERKAKTPRRGIGKFLYGDDPATAALGAQFIGCLHGEKSCIDAVRPEQEAWSSNKPGAILNTSDNTKGGYLVPDELIPQLIVLREQHGVVRRNATLRTVSSPSGHQPRLKAGQEAVFVSEPLTEDFQTSDLTFDNISYNLRRMSAGVPASEDIVADSIIDISAEVFRDAMVMLARREDRACLLGAGESINGGIHGIIPILMSGDYDESKVQLPSGQTTFATANIAGLQTVVGTIPEFADDGNAKWFVSRFGKANMLDRLKLTAGGNTVVILESGVRSVWNSYPIEVSQLLERRSSSTQSAAAGLYGNMAMSSTFFTDNQISMRLFTEHAPLRHQILYRTSQRIDFNFHERNSEGEFAGPLVVVQFAGS